MDKKWIKKEMTKELFRSHTVGHLDTLIQHEIGGLPRMLINLTLAELGGRSIAANNSNTDSVNFDYKYFLSVMFNSIADTTGNNDYNNNEMINFLYTGWRNGLAHLLVPVKGFSIGDNDEQRENHMSFKDNLLIMSDKQFSSDLVCTFNKFINEYEKKSIKIYVENNEADRVDLNYYIKSSNFI